MKLGLFENPYVDPEQALEVVNNPASQKRADDAHRSQSFYCETIRIYCLN